MHRGAKGTLEYGLPLLFFILVALLVFGKPLFTGKSLVLFDEFDEAFPLQKYFFESIKSGSFPLWNSYILCGYPLISQAQIGMWYPLTWLFVIFPSIIAVNILLLLPYIFGAFFTYLYTREIKFSKIASILSGLTFAYSGYLIGHFVYNTGVNHTAIWLPLILFFIQKAIKHSNWKFLLGSTGCYGLAVLAGHGQIFVYTALIILIYGIYSSYRNKNINPLLFCFVTILCGGLIASIQIIPSWEAVRLSIRSKLSYPMFCSGSLEIKQFISGLINPIKSGPDSSLYLLPISFILAILGIISLLQKKTIFSTPQKQLGIFWLIILIISILLILGNNTPLYRIMYYLFPYNQFRVAFRNSFEFGFAVSLLAGFGLEFLLTQKENLLNKKTFVIIGTILVAVLFIIFCFNPRLAIEHSALFLLIKFCLAGWCLILIMQFRKSAVQLLLISLFLFEPPIYLHHWFTRFTSDWLSTYPNLPLVKFLKTNCTAQESRYLPYNIFENLPLQTRVFALNLPNLIPAASLGGVEPVMLKRYDQVLGSGVGTVPPSIGINSFSFCSMVRNNPVLLNMLNTKYFLVPSENENLYLEHPSGIRAAGRIITLEINPTYLSRVDVISYLSNAVEVPDHQPVANIILVTSEGNYFKEQLRAGDETAEWAWERPGVKEQIKHQKPSITYSYPVDTSFQGHLYRGQFELDNRYQLSRIELEYASSIPQTGIHFCDFFGYDAVSKQTTRLTLKQAVADPIWIKRTTINYIDIYQNTQVLPRAWLVSKVTRLSDREIFDILRTGRYTDGTAFHPDTEALIETGAIAKFGNIDTTSTVKIINYTPNQVELKVYSTQSSFLVFSDIYYPGWKALVNGKKQPIYQTNYILRGIFIPPGNNQIQFIYKPFSFKLGLTISIISLLFLLSFTTVPFKSKRH